MGGLAGLAMLSPSWAAAQPADADSALGKPVWEAGVVMGGGWLPDYPGARQSHARGLLAPLVIYRGPLLRIDQEGVHGRLIRHPHWEFDLTASAAFNARANEARAGMPPLDYLFGIGPQLVYKGWRHAPGMPTLHLKLSELVSTDFRRMRRRGEVLEPELRWQAELPGAWAGTRLGIGLQASWASRSLNGYFYDVAPPYATATRPAYAARAGYLGSQLRLSITRRLGANLSGFVGLQAMSWHGSANAGSPLLLSRSGVSAGIGMLWIPWRSEARAAVD